MTSGTSAARPGFDDLYQEIILDHNRHPRNFGALAQADRKVEGYNPLCGDRVTVFLKLGEGDGRIDDISFEGSGCAISTASASLMTEALKGRTVAEAEELFQKVHALLAGREPAAPHGTDASADPHDPDDPFGEVGKLAALAGVRNYPMRVKCATLAWHALHSALAPLAPIAAGAASTEA